MREMPEDTRPALCFSSFATSPQIRCSHRQENIKAAFSSSSSGGPSSSSQTTLLTTRSVSQITLLENQSSKSSLSSSVPFRQVYNLPKVAHAETRSIKHRASRRRSSAIPINDASGHQPSSGISIASRIGSVSSISSRSSRPSAAAETAEVWPGTSTARGTFYDGNFTTTALPPLVVASDGGISQEEDPFYIIKNKRRQEVSRRGAPAIIDSIVQSSDQSLSDGSSDAPAPRSPAMLLGRNNNCSKNSVRRRRSSVLLTATAVGNSNNRMMDKTSPSNSQILPKLVGRNVTFNMPPSGYAKAVDGPITITMTRKSTRHTSDGSSMPSERNFSGKSLERSKSTMITCCGEDEGSKLWQSRLLDSTYDLDSSSQATTAEINGVVPLAKNDDAPESVIIIGGSSPSLSPSTTSPAITAACRRNERPPAERRTGYDIGEAYNGDYLAAEEETEMHALNLLEGRILDDPRKVMMRMQPYSIISCVT